MTIATRDINVLNKLSSSLNIESSAGTLLDNITPSHVVKYAGKHTTVGGAAAEDISLSGVVAGDIVICSLIQKGATPRTLLTSITATNKVTLTFSGDPSTDHIVGYMVLRVTP